MTSRRSATAASTARRDTGEYCSSLAVLAVDFGAEHADRESAANRAAQVYRLIEQHQPSLLCVTNLPDEHAAAFSDVVRAANRSMEEGTYHKYKSGALMLRTTVIVNTQHGTIDVARSGAVLTGTGHAGITHVIVGVDEGEPARVAVATAMFGDTPRKRVLDAFDLEHTAGTLMRGVSGALLVGDLRLTPGEDARLLLRGRGFSEAATPSDNIPAVWMRARAAQRAEGADGREWKLESSDGSPTGTWAFVRYILTVK